MRVALYCRVSRESQDLSSQRTQLVAALKSTDTLVRDGADDADCFEDHGEYSGTSDRPALNRLRELVALGRVDQIRVTERDRLMRVGSIDEKLEYLLLRKDLEQAGVQLADTFGNLWSGTSAEDQLLEDIWAGVAGFERRKARERTLRAKLEAAKAGRVTNPGRHWWLEWDIDTKRYVIKEHEAARLQGIICRLLQGESLQHIVEWLTASGVQSPRSGAWHTGVVSRMLRNPALVGRPVQHRWQMVEPSERVKAVRKTRSRRTSSRMRPTEEWFETQCPALISEETFDEIQRRLSENAKFSLRNAQRQYLLSGLLRCAVCGRTWVGQASNGRWLLYGCNGKSRRHYFPGEPCPTKRFAAHRIEQPVWDAVCRLLENPEMVLAELRQLREKDESYYANIETELAEIDKRILPALGRQRDTVLDSRRQLPELYTIEVTKAEMMKVQVDEDRVHQRRHELVEKLEQRRISAEQIADVEHYCERVRGNLGLQSFEDRRQIIRLLIREIRIDGERLSWTFWVPTSSNPLAVEQAAAIR